MAKAHRTLPEGYAIHQTLDFSHNLKATLLMNLAVFVLIVPLAWFARWFLAALHPQTDVLRTLLDTSTATQLTLLAILIGLCILVFSLHEAIHGAFFWLLTRERPRFGFKIRSLSLYAAAPDWFLTRNQHLIVGLAPLVLITAAGLALALLLPPGGSLAAVGAVVINASGAAGDLIVVIWLLTKSPDTLVRDTGDAFTLYQPALGAPAGSEA